MVKEMLFIYLFFRNEDFTLKIKSCIMIRKFRPINLKMEEELVEEII